MYVGSIRALILGLVCFGVLALHLRSASAETGSADLVLQKIAALEARVAALETKNREYKREAKQGSVPKTSGNLVEEMLPPERSETAHAGGAHGARFRLSAWR